jgi:negative regulator of flagellin synthesis FlgM
MTIERLGPVDPLQNPRKTSRSERASQANGSDSVSLSKEAVEKGEAFQAYELARTAPDVRADRIAELKSKIDDPAYINEAVVQITAEKIIDQLFG